jgi:hypothetical protein
VGARFSAPVQTGPGGHPASCTMGTGSFRGVESSRGVTLTPHPLSSAEVHKQSDYPSSCTKMKNIKSANSGRTQVTCNFEHVKKRYWTLTQLFGSTKCTKTINNTPIHKSNKTLYKGKAIPLQAWTGPQGSSRLRLPDLKTIGT